MIRYRQTHGWMDKHLAMAQSALCTSSHDNGGGGEDDDVGNIKALETSTESVR